MLQIMQISFIEENGIDVIASLEQVSHALFNWFKIIV